MSGRGRPGAKVIVAAMGLGLALTGLMLPASAQPSPTISIAPAQSDAGPSTERWSILVQGQNWSPGTITLQFAGQTVGSASPRSDGTFSATVTPTKRNAGNYQVAALQNPCAPQGDCTVGREAFFRAIPQSSFNNPCGPTGSVVTLTVVGSYFAAQNFGYVFYDAGGPDEQSRQRVPTGSGTFSVSFSVTIPDRRVTISVYDGQENAAPDITWQPVRCSSGTTTSTTNTTEVVPDDTTTTQPGDDPVPDDTTTTTPTPSDAPGVPVTIPPTIDLPPPTPGATLTVTPELGPAGFVTGATGTGFPPGAVTLAWTPGIGRTTAIVAPDGTFTARMLVFPNDRLGPRALVATGGATSAFDAFLVVQSSVQPSGQNVQRINRIRRFNRR